MTREQAHAYVKVWGETGRTLEEIKWREVAAIERNAA
jgi:hypothetical protein